MEFPFKVKVCVLQTDGSLVQWFPLDPSMGHKIYMRGHEMIGGVGKKMKLLVLQYKICGFCFSNISILCEIFKTILGLEQLFK